MTADDLVIVDLAEEIAALREHAALAAIYRELAQTAITRVAEQNAELERQRRQLAALRAELRATRKVEAA